MTLTLLISSFCSPASSTVSIASRAAVIFSVLAGVCFLPNNLLKNPCFLGLAKGWEVLALGGVMVSFVFSTVSTKNSSLLLTIFSGTTISSISGETVISGSTVPSVISSSISGAIASSVKNSGISASTTSASSAGVSVNDSVFSTGVTASTTGLAVGWTLAFFFPKPPPIQSSNEKVLMPACFSGLAIAARREIVCQAKDKTSTTAAICPNKAPPVKRPAHSQRTKP